MSLADQIREAALLEGDFVLRSGRRSSYYLDKYRFGTRPDLLRALGIHFATPPLVGGDPDKAERAAKLAKADLVSEMVGEFPGLSKLDENENLVNTSDFRAMYCSLLDQWFKSEHTDLIIPEAASFARPQLIKS